MTNSFTFSQCNQEENSSLEKLPFTVASSPDQNELVNKIVPCSLNCSPKYNSVELFYLIQNTFIQKLSFSLSGSKELSVPCGEQEIA